MAPPADGAPSPVGSPKHAYVREAGALVLLVGALFALLALATFQGDPMRSEVEGANWVGPVGAALARVSVATLGLAAWLLPLELGILAAPLLGGKPTRFTWGRLAGDLLMAVVLASLSHVAFPRSTAFGAMPFGGALGELFGEVSRALFSSIGSYIVGLTIVGLILMGRATFSFIEWVQTLRAAALQFRQRGTGGLRSLLGALKNARSREQRARLERQQYLSTPKPQPLSAGGDALIASSAVEPATVVRVPSEFPPAPAPRSVPSPSASSADERPDGAGSVVLRQAGEPVRVHIARIAPAHSARTDRRGSEDSDDQRMSAPARARSGASAGESGTLEQDPADASETRGAAEAGKVTPVPGASFGRSALTRSQLETSAEPSWPLPGALVPDPMVLERNAAGDLSPKASPFKGSSPRIVPPPQMPLHSARAVEGAEPGSGPALRAVGSPVTSVDAAALRPERSDERASSPLSSAKPLEDSALPPAMPHRGESLPFPKTLDSADAERDFAEGFSVDSALERSPAPAPSLDASPELSVSTGASPGPSKVSDPEEDEPTDASPVAPAESLVPPSLKPPMPSFGSVRAKVVPALGGGFRLPSPTLLDPSGPSEILVDEEQLQATAQMLEKTLFDYGVSGKVEEIHPGPTVTTFEVSPAAGTKVSKVASLADDLALGLSRKVRIIAPIPGKNRIGFEVPNAQRSPVNLRELVEDSRFLDMTAPLPCVLGRDIIGNPYFADLSAMPHVIVAGATGAGKSVGLNVMLVSLLSKRTPDELRLLMIDPKVVELAPFDRIPHMLLPVVTDMKQAANALKWAVDEMERRYQLFASAGTKNIGTYNGWVERVAKGEAKPPKPPKRVTAVAPDGSDVEVDAAIDGSDAALPEKLPYIVIVVDEFADLMMQQGKDVEASVARLAQKARAAGMHVILATQRPSVDVITGMIKANFPTRIAFRVAQKVDSRTILDEQGAEHLLGRGDMLVKMNGATDTKRVQCPFCSEEEVQRVTDFLRLQGEPVYDEAILKRRDDEGGEEGEDEDVEADAMYDAAVRVVADTRRCSTSWIQRKLGIGYNRAAKLVEAMEKRGIIGPANGAKDREILISSFD